jgi:L-fuconolactonase
MPTNPKGNDIHIPVRPEWLALHDEPVLEPDLPIIDPHHHLWDRPGARYLLQDLIEDTSRGHRILATVFIQCQAMYRACGPDAFKPIGETEFVNGIAAMAASGIYGPTLACAGIVGHADLRLGDAVEETLIRHIRAGGDRFRGIRHITASDADPSLLNPRSAAPRHLMQDTAFLFAAGRSRPEFRRLDLPPSDPRTRRAGFGLSEHDDHPRPRRRPHRNRRLCRTPR